MQIPHVPDGVQEAPARAMRAVFAGIGQLLLTAELPGVPAPVPNYDDLSLAWLRGRLRRLDQAKLRVLAGYERAHADREAVVAMSERRIAKLETTKD
jgi:hypothetical protein